MVINLGMWVRTFLSTSWVAPYRCFQIEGLVVLRCHFKFNDFWTILLGDIVAHLSWCRQEQRSLEVDRYLEGITRGELTVFICGGSEHYQASYNQEQAQSKIKLLFAYVEAGYWKHKGQKKELYLVTQPTILLNLIEIFKNYYNW